MREDQSPQARPRVFIGACIDVESERVVLRALYDHLAKRTGWSVVLANFHCDGRQIDFVVGCDHGTLLIEAKQYRWPVHGAENGRWEMHFSTTSTRSIRNAYRQALDAKNLLRDHISGRLREGAYPDACVLAVPSLPAGSSVPSDSKVMVRSLLDLEGMLQKQSALRLREEEWVELAAGLSLESIDNLEMAFHESLSESRRLVDGYVREFLHAYGEVDLQLKPDSYEHDGKTEDKDQAADAVLAGASITVVRGPSGCGKSLLGRYMAVTAAKRSVVPVVIQAKYFQGQLRECLNKEVALLGTGSAAQLMSSIRRLGSSSLLVIDGYNECPATERLTLSRSARAFARRYSAACVVSSQIALEGTARDDERSLLVRAPSQALKHTIAASAVVGAVQPSSVSALLDAVQTGLEADLIGQVGMELGPDASTFAVFARFVRRKLGDQDAEGIGFLAALAGSLVEAASFSTSISQIDRLAHRTRFPADMRRRLIAARVLAERIDRVSFCHELFMQAFSAEWAVREAAGNVEVVLTSLASPRYAGCRALIIGALEDPSLQRLVLERIIDPDVLAAAYTGKCGEVPRLWAVAQLTSVLAKAAEEAEQLTFYGKNGSFIHAQVDPLTQLSWSKQERAALAAVTQLACEGPLLDVFLQAVSSLDVALGRAWKSLVDEGMGSSRARSEAFQLLVLFGSEDIALTSAINGLSGGMGYRGRAGRETANRIDLIWNTNASLMQLYVLVQLAGQQYGNRHLFAEKTAELLRTRWHEFPYHLRLALLHLARMGGEVSEAQKQLLVGALQTLPSTNAWLDTPIVDALGSLGALRDGMWAQYDGIVEELRGILERKLEPAAWEDAYHFYAKQTDHPYGDAYCEAVRSLSSDERAQLLAMACRTTSEYASFMCFLVREMSKLVTPGDAFALESIQCRLALPSLETHGPQDAIDTFVAAHEVLGKLGGALPDLDFYNLDDRPERIALLGCARLAYFHPHDRTGAGPRVKDDGALGLLTSVGATQALAAIALVEWSHYGELNPDNRFVHRFREACVDFARQGLREAAQPREYFGRGWSERSHRAMAISILDRHGDRSDLGALRELVDDPEVGIGALAAIKKLEGA